MNPVSHVASRRFDKSRRLRRRPEFQRVFDNGQRGRGKFLTILAVPRQNAGTRLGIVASKKLGNAVRRNRAKRLIREIFRNNQPVSPAAGRGLDIIVIPRSELFEASYASLEDDFRTQLARCAGRLSRS